MASEGEIELAWAAGFYDGEGGCYAHLDKRDGSVRIQISLKQVDIRPLERFKSAVGVGNIRGPYQGNKAYHQGQYRWYAYSQNAYTFLEKIYDYLSEPKKEQINKVLLKIEENKKERL